MKNFKNANMQSENTCRLCLLSNNNIINFSSEEGLNLQISNIVSQHFWFKIQQNDGLPHAVCRICWSNTKEFHEFYNSIEIAHERFKGIAINGDDCKYNENYAIKSVDNNVEKNYNLIVETIHQQSDYVALEDPMDLVKLEVIDTKVENYGVENDNRFEIFNEPKYNLIEKETTKDENKKLSNKKLISLKKRINKIHKEKIKQPKSIKGKRRKARKIIEEEEEEVEEEIKIDEIDVDDSNFNNYNNSNNIIEDGDDDDGDQNSHNYEKINLTKKLYHEPEIIIAEENKKNATTLQRDADDIKIREFFILNCHLCAATHLTFTEVKTHYRIVHKIKRGFVICCKKKLFERCQLLEHMQWHLNPDEFRCSICNKLYSDRYGLKLHMNFHVSPDDRHYSCDICGKRFSLKHQLKQHFTLTHIAHQNKIYKCNECDKCFGLKSALQNHVSGVHEFKNAHICHICAKVFKSKLQCDIHLSDHFKIEKVQCQICGSLLKNKSSLKKHVRRSHVEKPIECKDCGRMSQNKEALRSHMKYVHEGLRLHKCNFCDKAFKKAINLREHIAGHTGSALYTCPYCPKSFNSNGNMHSHKRKSHLIEWQEDRNKRKTE